MARDEIFEVQDEHDEYCIFVNAKGVQYFALLYNCSWGGFGFSETAKNLYIERKGISRSAWSDSDVERFDPVMIQIVREIGFQTASGQSAQIKIKLVPWVLRDYYTLTETDGSEYIILKKDKYKLSAIRDVVKNCSVDELKSNITEILDEMIPGTKDFREDDCCESVSDYNSDG